VRHREGRSEEAWQIVEGTYDTYNLSFDVSCSTGQTRLLKFLDFVEFKAEKDD